MGLCYLCNKLEREQYMFYYCSKCLKMQNLINLYDVDTIIDILDLALIRDKKQLETKKNLLNKYDVKDLKNKQKEINKEIIKKFKNA